MSIWKNEYLRYKYFWGTIFGIEFLLDILHILHILPMVDGVDMIYSIHFWEKLGKEFAWHPFTLALYYFEHLEKIRGL